MTTTPEQHTARLSASVAEEVLALLGRRRMSQAQLARALGQSQMWVSDRLRGIRPFSLDDLERIADVLSVSVFELIRRATEAGTPNPRLSQVSRSAVPRQPNGRISPHTTNGLSPMAPQRRDRTRPVSAIPATRRRPTPVKPPSRPMVA